MVQKSQPKKPSTPKQPPKKPKNPPKAHTPDDGPRPASPIDSEGGDATGAAATKHRQQLILNLFSDAFAAVLSSDSFPALLQEIKQALFRRDFDAAFGREDYLEAYAARWSPTRALCYASILEDIKVYTEELSFPPLPQPETTPASSSPRHESPPDHIRAPEAAPAQKTIKMLAIGGCASEHVAFASHLRQPSASSPPLYASGSLTLLDAAPWAHATSLLQQCIVAPPPLSQYASAAARAANRAFLDPGDAALHLAFHQADVLGLEPERWAELVGPPTEQGRPPLLVTLMFTLNELYTNGGIGKTTKLLKRLGEVLPDRSLLLVVDSPGSYSEAAVGKEKKKYPMQWLLNHTLIESSLPSKRGSSASSSQDYEWRQLESKDSVWFRLPEGLDYPIPLENMRYQMHLYRREKIPSQ